MKPKVNRDLRGKKIFVGLSGGVDSAVTAAMLKERGAEITGVFIKGWYPPELPCTWAEERRDAMRVAAHLDIPFYTLDASAEYKRAVIDYLIREYQSGRTPNPDIMCNRDVKFGVFHRFAKAHGADAIATGHYACILENDSGMHLLRGVDETKDQSYFLWAVPREALANTHFPLGGLYKKEVRALARRYRLPNADKKDSQGICFLGPVSMDDFLRAEIPHDPGVALDLGGGEVGRHDGAVLYTLGERVALSAPLPGPWYVQAKDLEANTLTVSHEHRASEPVESIKLSNLNWLTAPTAGDPLTAQYRYHGPRISGHLSETLNTFVVDKPLPEPLAQGQSLALYCNEELLGGGIIEGNAKDH